MSQDSSERLEKLVGFDVAKPQSVTSELFKEVMEEVEEKRKEDAKGVARELITKAIELRTAMSKAKREFEGQERKFNKELGKILNRLEQGLRGGSTEPAEEDSDSE